MTLQEIIARLAKIDEEVRTAEKVEAIDKLATEKKELLERKAELEEIEARKQTALDITAGAVTPNVLETRKGKNMDFEKMSREEILSSKEYRSAFLKNLIGGDLNVEERAAFTATTANTSAALPTTMLNQIWDLVSKSHVIMSDITIYRTGTILEVVKHTAVVQGAAKTVAEGVANDDEQNTFVKVTLSGKDFSKHVVISYAMATMSIEALENYLITEIATSIGEALADDAIATIKAGTATGNKVTTAGTKVIAYKELATLFGKLKKVGAPVVYVNNSTFYNYLISMEDTTGRPIFQPSVQAGAQGAMLGAAIKIEESVGDNEILVGDPKRVVCNMVQDILIEQDRDIKNHTKVFAGYARAESALLNDTSFALLTVKQS